MFLTGSRHRGAGAVAVVGVAAALATAGAAPSLAAAPTPAPEFTLELLNGGTLALDAIRGSPAILLFWAPW